MPGMEFGAFRIVVNTRDERGHEPHVHVIKGRTKCKIVLDDSLTPYDIVRMAKRDVQKAASSSARTSATSSAFGSSIMAKGVPERIAVRALSDQMYDRGVQNAKKEGEPYDVVRAAYNRTRDALDLTLRKGVTVSFPRAQIREIANAKPGDLAKIVIQPSGDGISIPKIDVDIDVPGLLAEELGSMFAAAMGRRTRGRTTVKKAAASRANGQKGGRPKKRTVAAA